MGRWQGRGDDYLVIGARLVVALVVLGVAIVGAWAQDAPSATESGQPTGAPTAAGDPAETEPADAGLETPVEGSFTSEELQALVAPIALYPDLVLVLVLQASLAPLDIVQADRFLADYAEDPSLTPDADWDDSVVGLLNYPSVVRTMSGDLDWTETLGTAVIEQLEGVQDAIQEFRGFMRAIGALESNEQVTVIAEGDIIRIEPADANAVFIPEYDPDALLAALYSTDVAPEPAASEGEAAGSEEVVAYDEVTATEGELIEEEGAVVESAPVAAAPVAEPAPVVVPAAAPAYYPAVAPPPVTYSDPSPSWLGTAATFAGGAAVGGLVGWAIADDDDDHDNDGDNYSHGNIDIEDSTITVNRGPDEGDLEDLQRRLEDERGDRQDRREDQLGNVQDQRRERADRQAEQRAESKQQLQDERLKREAREKEQRAEAKRQLEQRYPQKRARTTATGGATKDKVSGLAASGSKQRTASRGTAGDKQLAARVDQAKVKADPRRPVAQTRRTPTKSKSVRPGDRRQPQVAGAFGGAKSAQQAKRESDRGLKSRSRAKTTVKPNRSRSGGSAFAQRGGGGKARSASNNRGKKTRRGNK